MKFVRSQKPHSATRPYVFQISKREKTVLFSTLKLYPLLDAAHHQLSRDPKTAGAAEQEWLEEAMEQQKQEHKKKLNQFFESDHRFFKDEGGDLRFVLNGEQLEWMLRVLNEIRVGSWVRLGRPEMAATRRLSLNSGQARFLAAMELSGYFAPCWKRLVDTMANSAAMAVLPGNPVITSASILAAGHYQFSFTDGNGGSAYSVLAATNASLPPSNWTALTTVSNISPGFFQFTDPQTATNAARFYTVISP